MHSTACAQHYPSWYAEPSNRRCLRVVLNRYWCFIRKLLLVFSMEVHIDTIARRSNCYRNVVECGVKSNLYCEHTYNVLLSLDGIIPKYCCGSTRCTQLLNCLIEIILPRWFCVATLKNSWIDTDACAVRRARRHAHVFCRFAKCINYKTHFTQRSVAGTGMWHVRIAIYFINDSIYIAVFLGMRQKL